MYQKWGGDNVLKVCPSIQWSLNRHTILKMCSFIEFMNRSNVFVHFFISEWYLLSLPFNNNDVIFSGLTLPSPHYHHPLGEKFQPKSF